ARLAANFSGFMTYFLDSGLDYHIGVVSTNMDTGATAHQGRLRSIGGARWIEPATPDPVEVFRQMALMGTDSHYNEKGREAAYLALALRRDTDNLGFYREDANLAIVVISDEDDYSTAEYISQQA